jgi:hypothetical protein
VIAYKIHIYIYKKKIKIQIQPIVLKFVIINFKEYSDSESAVTIVKRYHFSFFLDMA